MGGAKGRRIRLEDRIETVALIQEAQQSGCRVRAACDKLAISKRTFERWNKCRSGDQRRGPLSEPANKMSSVERKSILDVVNSTEHQDKSPSQIVPLLADKGLYLASESSFYRILKAESLSKHRGRSKPATRHRPKALTASGPNQIYSWDITYLKSSVAGMFFYLYFFMDIYSRKIVGYAVHDEQSSEHGSDLIRDICKTEGVCKDQVVLHSDNGGPMKGATMLATLQKLGILPSFSRPRVSDDNPYSEALFKTTKYCPQYPSKPFESIAGAMAWVQIFVNWYNEEHLHSGIKFVTPASRHRGEDGEILAKRKLVYKFAKQLRPERWSGATRNWEEIDEVKLNHLPTERSEGIRIMA